jgi:hypothetical protein
MKEEDYRPGTVTMITYIDFSSAGTQSADIGVDRETTT